MKGISTKVDLSILKPVAEVFAAFRNPVPFFTSETSGPLETGKEIVWKFVEFPKGFSVWVRKVVPNELIQYEWASGIGKGKNFVEVTFHPRDKSTTTVSVTESGWPDTKKGRERSYGNTAGWMHMLSSLKAFLEYGVNIRKGAFVHMKFE